MTGVYNSSTLDSRFVVTDSGGQHCMPCVHMSCIAISLSMHIPFPKLQIQWAGLRTTHWAISLMIFELQLLPNRCQCVASEPRPLSLRVGPLCRGMQWLLWRHCAQQTENVKSFEGLLKGTQRLYNKQYDSWRHIEGSDALTTDASDANACQSVANRLVIDSNGPFQCLKSFNVEFAIIFA